MNTYEEMLDEAYKRVRIVEKGNERFDVPKVISEILGKNTIISNIMQIASYIRRPVEHLAKFLQKQLATSGKIEKERLILNTKLNSSKINEKISQYVNEFVLCNECKKPDTEIIGEKGIKFKHCLACGAKSSLKSKI